MASVPRHPYPLNRTLLLASGVNFPPLSEIHSKESLPNTHTDPVCVCVFCGRGGKGGRNRRRFIRQKEWEFVRNDTIKEKWITVRDFPPIMWQWKFFENNLWPVCSFSFIPSHTQTHTRHSVSVFLWIWARAKCARYREDEGSFVFLYIHLDECIN